MSRHRTGSTAIQPSAVEQIAAAVLYEGYILYPYRASAPKNQHRFNFGTLAPATWCERNQVGDNDTMRAECLIVGLRPKVSVRARFLHPMTRQVARFHQPQNQWHAATDDLPRHEFVASLEVNGEMVQTWQEVVEREFRVEATAAAPAADSFSFPASRDREPLLEADGLAVGFIERMQPAVCGQLEVTWEEVAENVQRVAVEVRNTTPWKHGREMCRSEAMLSSLASAHAILTVEDSEFVSLLEPPDEYAAAAAECVNQGCWPVLVGQQGDRSTMFASPIILYDYPQIAAESAGDFFDGCEIDEMLALRVMTLTDDEKRQMQGLDDRTRQILERTDHCPEDYLMKLHGGMRRPDPEQA